MRLIFALLEQSCSAQAILTQINKPRRARRMHGFGSEPTPQALNKNTDSSLKNMCGRGQVGEERSRACVQAKRREQRVLPLSTHAQSSAPHERNVRNRFPRSLERRLTCAV